jgi:5-bromo-4-chloroindolyl phosphate hydrolysis protein
MGKQSDRDQNYMREMWGTEKLITDYTKTPSKMLREINNDDLTPKKHDFAIQNEIHEKIRNDDDYDDWEYGTEPLYEVKKN